METMTMVTKGDDLLAALELPVGEERLEVLRDAVRDHAALVVAYPNEDGALIVDVQTARLLVTVADALNERNREHFLGLDLPVAVDLAWRLVG